MRVCLFVFITACAGLLSHAQEQSSPEGIQFFESKIRPLLADNCYRCHSASEKIRGGLVLDSRAGLRQGGDSGDALIPGDPDASLLLRAVRWEDEDYQMPPKEKLSEATIADIQKWIRMGAPDPRGSDEVAVTREIDFEAAREHWSFQVPAKKVLPKVKKGDWPIKDLDHFVLSKLEKRGFEPAPEAQPAELLRRLSFDLVGLPVSPAEVNAFLVAWRESPEKAYAEAVDAMLDRPQFGERWGRHWLDVARYAESSGKEINTTFPQAWRYRDYVIDAFNADKPYDEFVREQVAGDLLPAKNDAVWQEHLVATGFLALGPKGLNERNARQFAADVVDEQIDTLSQAVLGLTVACARCHDHKSEAIPTTDYYALAGIFQNTKTFFGTLNQGNTRRATNLLELPQADEVALKTFSKREQAALRNRLEKAEKEFAEVVRQRAQERRNPSRKPGSNELVRRFQRLRSSTALMRSTLESIEPETGAMKALAMGVQEASSIKGTKVLIRGDVDKPGDEVERGFLQVLPHTADSKLPGEGSGRLELAEWLTSPSNPLTARVYVNRAWQHLFGQGLVETPNDFGVSGRAPTHPEMLDHLAANFMETGWSTKTLIRQLVHSKTYRMSSKVNERALSEDPNNALLWRQVPQRLDAESLRDALLFVSGRLDLDRPLGSEVGSMGSASFGTRIRQVGSSKASLEYRSVYLPMVRDAVPESLALFDAADTNLVTGKRESTSVPGQALYMMNNPFVIAQSKALSERVIKEAKKPRERVALAYQIVYGRSASNQEIASAMRYLGAFYKATKGKKAKRGRPAFESLCQSLLASAEFRYIN